MKTFIKRLLFYMNMVSLHVFDQGRAELEALLNREVSATKEIRDYEIRCWMEGIKEQCDGKLPEGYTSETVESDLKEEPVFIYVRTDQDYFVGRGTHQAVLDLGNGLVAKGPIEKGKPTIEKVRERFSNILPFGWGRYKFTRETLDNLRGIFNGTDIIIPEVSFYLISWNDRKDSLIVSPNVSHAGLRDLANLLAGDIKPEFPPANVYVTPDLRESGKFNVKDYDEKVAETLINGLDVVRNFNSAFDYLMRRYVGNVDVATFDKAKGPYLKRKPHGPDFSSETAIRNMFLLQVPVDKKVKGRLVIGDVDHVSMFY